MPQIKGLVYFDADRSEAEDRPYDMSLRNAPGSMAVFRRLARDPYFDVGAARRRARPLPALQPAGDGR